VALGSEDIATAETEAKAGIAADKGNWVANYAMGRVLIAQGKTDEAFKLFEKGKGLKGRADNRDYLRDRHGLGGARRERRFGRRDELHQGARAGSEHARDDDDARLHVRSRPASGARPPTC
jgi:hypothetical protein